MSFSRELKNSALDVWEAGFRHPFVQGLGDGTLPKDAFQFYLLQDYQYLLQYAKVFAIAATKADSEALMTRFSTIQYDILAHELDLHRGYMQQFGIAPDAVARTPASLFNRTYTANMLALGQTGDLAQILAAVFPCAWTYADYAKRLQTANADTLADNFYRSWIEKYASDEFSNSFAWFYDTLDELCAGKSAQQLQDVEQIFVSSVEFEYLFWDMAYKQEFSYQL